MEYVTVIEQFRRASSQMIQIEAIRTNEVLQPRVARLVPIRDKARTVEHSEQHVTGFRLFLEAAEQKQLDPVWIAAIDDGESVDAGFYLVDGHHRLSAYKQARRQEIPAQVLPLTWRTAVMVSKLVNCMGRSLPMHSAQCRDAAWQYLAVITQRGASGLPRGESIRTVASRFGVSKTTISKMLTRLPEVDPSEFNALAIDHGTGWPRWRHVVEQGQPWSTTLPSSDAEQLERDAEKFARHFVKLMDESSPMTRARAFEMLANDEVEATDQLASVELLAQFSPLPPGSVPIGTPAVPARFAHMDT